MNNPVLYKDHRHLRDIWAAVYRVSSQVFDNIQLTISRGQRHITSQQNVVSDLMGFEQVCIATFNCNICPTGNPKEGHGIALRCSMQRSLTISSTFGVIGPRHAVCEWRARAAPCSMGISSINCSAVDIFCSAFPGFTNFVPALACQFFLTFPAAISQLRNGKSAEFWTPHALSHVLGIPWSQGVWKLAIS